MLRQPRHPTCWGFLSWGPLRQRSRLRVLPIGYNVGLLEVGSERCQQKHYVLIATAKEPLTAASVEALVRNPSQVLALETAILAAEVVAAAAMFVVAPAKLNRQTKRRQLPQIIVLFEAPHDPFGTQDFPSASRRPLSSYRAPEGLLGFFEAKAPSEILSLAEEKDPFEAQLTRSLSVNWERHETNVLTGPPRMPNTRSLVAAGGATSAPA